MIYRLLRNSLAKLLRNLDIDAELNEGKLHIIIRLEHLIIFKRTINLKTPNR